MELSGGWAPAVLALLLLLLPRILLVHGHSHPDAPFKDLEVARVSCNAAYSAPCARTNAQWLARKTANQINADISANKTTFDQAMADITNGNYNHDTGFYPFVLEKKTGLCMGHGVSRNFVGLTLKSVFVDVEEIGFTDPDALLERFVKAANDENACGWVQYFWGGSGSIHSKLAYATNVTDDYLLAVGYENERLPYDLPCSADYDSWCSITNTLSLIGQAQFLVEQAESLSQFESAIYQLSYDKKYNLPGSKDGVPFYTFMFAYDGTMKSHAILRGYFGKTLAEMFEQKESSSYEEGQALHESFVQAAEGRNGGWVRYPWTNGRGEASSKVAFIVKIDFQGTPYYLGAGFGFQTLVGEDEETEDWNCTHKYNLPCAFRTSLHLSSHALTHAISSQSSIEETWRDISLNPSFHSNDFYLYVYDFNGTCVAHGGLPELVGMEMDDIYRKFNVPLDDERVSHMHQQFTEAAVGGGGWVLYDWLIPGVPNSYFPKIAYVFRINIHDRSYYGAVGFNHERAPVSPHAEGRTLDGSPILCTMEFGLPCSEANVNAIVGNAAAELTLASSKAREGVRFVTRGRGNKTMEDVLNAITQRDQAFTVNDFFVSVFQVNGTKCANGTYEDGCCVAHGGNPKMVGKTWQEILDMDNITSVKGKSLHDRLERKSHSNGGSFQYLYSRASGDARTKRAVVTRFENNGEALYVVSEYFLELPPATCDMCPEGWECTTPTQAYCSERQGINYMKPLYGVLPLALLGLLAVLFSVCFYWYKRRNWKKRQKLAQKIMQMEKQMKDMVEIVHDTGMQITSAQDYKDKFGLDGVGVSEQDPTQVEVVWYWEEHKPYLSRHHPSRILGGTNFVKYLDTSMGPIEHAYQRYKAGKGFKEYRLDLKGKINKFDSFASGSQYMINFEDMTQKNIWSEYTRALRRIEHIQTPLDSEVMDRLPRLPVDIDFFGNEGEDFLPTFQGQVIQVSKEHQDENWLYGSVMYDPLLVDAQNNPQGTNEGLNRILSMALHDRPTSGWFPAALSRPADVKVMQNLVESLGGEGVTNLKPPSTWKSHKEGCLPVAEGTEEYREVVHYFMAALYDQVDHVSVIGVERVQCMPLWQSYAVKKETMKTRDAKNPDNLVNNRNGTVERKWLFHGTTSEVIPKIIKQGFNRAFAGRNAVAFGKGVYFARDAAYSSHTSYSTPDSAGIQRMFLCRVAVGDWCQGNYGQLTPDPKPRNPLELFDTTVDDVTDPSIFVVYHDAQAYPEYLISFRRNDVFEN